MLQILIDLNNSARVINLNEVKYDKIANIEIGSIALQPLKQNVYIFFFEKLVKI